MEVSVWKWDSVSWIFIDDLPRSRAGNESIWVIVDRLTKSDIFFRVSPAKLVEIYLKTIVRLHEIRSIIFNGREPLFASEFWRSLQSTLGLELTYEYIIPFTDRWSNQESQSSTRGFVASLY